MIFLSTTSLFLSFLMISMTHPLSMGLTLLTQTILMTMMLSHYNINSWYSYILFMVLVGGMMILFLYMTSIASNEKFTPNIFFIPSIVITVLLSLTIWVKFESSNNINKEILSFNLTTLPSMFNKQFSLPMMITMILLFMYLLITMIATIKITKMNSGPLRQLN